MLLKGQMEEMKTVAIICWIPAEKLEHIYAIKLDPHSSPGNLVLQSLDITSLGYHLCDSKKNSLSFSIVISLIMLLLKMLRNYILFYYDQFKLLINMNIRKKEVGTSFVNLI